MEDNLAREEEIERIEDKYGHLEDKLLSQKVSRKELREKKQSVSKRERTHSLSDYTLFIELADKHLFSLGYRNGRRIREGSQFETKINLEEESKLTEIYISGKNLVLSLYQNGELTLDVKDQSLSFGYDLTNSDNEFTRSGVKVGINKLLEDYKNHSGLNPTHKYVIQQKGDLGPEEVIHLGQYDSSGGEILRSHSSKTGKDLLGNSGLIQKLSK